MTCEAISATAVLNLNSTLFNPIPFATPSRTNNSVEYSGSSHRRLRFHSTAPVNHERRRFVPKVFSSFPSIGAEEFPLLPFPMDQVFIPSEGKTLHLYEARYLALLDESLFTRKKCFIHFVLDPIGISDGAEASFAARYGCLVHVEKVERLDVGALVSIRGIGRGKIVTFVQADPYLKGLVIPVQDVICDCVTKINSQVMVLKEALNCLNSLEIKLKVPKEELLQTQISSSVNWAGKECSLDCYRAFFPSFAERLSFAALQPVSGLTHSELAKLQKEKLRAMDTKDTLQRLDQSLEFVKNNISMIAAKLAIQSLDAK
ncbi:uncharacterized protein LOC127799304 isoform X2 [Diospyros lotus]|uniref:uncharacterized protein LOC127799304 isoform X2 n=1 Tax=Diospyros lotus TaxID=55363 RepID=UPI0022590B6B|nr:uncharacterized protein LOC127799304 isoform X2 [Diospyros lotus]